MFVKRFAAVVLFFMTVLFAVPPANALPLALNQAVDLALKQNPEVLSSKNKWESAHAVVLKAYFIPDPKLGADFEDIPAGSATPGQAMTRYYNFTQEIPWPGMLLNEGKAASSRADTLKYSFLLKKREVIKEVKSAYYEIAKIDQLIKIMNVNVALMEQAYKVAQAKYAAGQASQVEALKMQVELNRMGNELQNMKDERSVKNRELGLLLNDAAEEDYSVDPLPEPLATQLDTDVETSPRLKMEGSSLEEMRAMKGSALSAYFPDTMIKWRNQNAGAAVGSNDLMFDFSVPLWFLFRQNRTLEEADKNVAAAEADYQAMKNMLLREIKDLSAAINIQQRKLKLYDSSLIPSSKAALEGSLSGYKSGQIDFMILLDSIRGYLDVNVEYHETLAGYHIKLAELDEISGKN